MKYDENLKNTAEWKTLYGRWRYYRQDGQCGPEFEEFINFYNWAMENGYRYGCVLRRTDPAMPFSPSNCSWGIARTDFGRQENIEAWIDKWNKAVNRIRKHYGMDPLPGTEWDDDNEGTTELLYGSSPCVNLPRRKEPKE